MGKALFSASKTLGGPSALRPQGDKKRGLRMTPYPVALSASEGPPRRSFGFASGRQNRGLRMTPRHDGKVCLQDFRTASFSNSPD